VEKPQSATEIKTRPPISLRNRLFHLKIAWISIILIAAVAGIQLGIGLSKGPWVYSLVALALLIIVVALCGFGLSSLRRKELEELKAAIDQLIVQNLGARFALEGPRDEMAGVIDSLNRALDLAVARSDQPMKLIGAVSHDLKTPLTIIRGDAEVGLLKPRSPEEYQEILRSNLEEVDRMSRLVNNLVVFIRAQRGELKLSPQPVELAELLSTVAEGYQKVAAAKGVDLVTSLKNNITVKVDRERVKQLLENLIENAIAYSPGGGKVELSTERREKEAWVCVKDHGIGIPTQDVPRIFDPFFRGEQATKIVKKGYGIGLTIAKHIAEAHQGRLELDSSLTNEPGSIFRLVLPLEQ